MRRNTFYMLVLAITTYCGTVDAASGAQDPKQINAIVDSVRKRDYGLGLSIVQQDGRTWIGHDGSGSEVIEIGYPDGKLEEFRAIQTND